MKNRRFLAKITAICFLVSTLLAPVARAQDQAPKPRDREEQPANEIAGSGFVAIKPQIVSSAALDLGILRLESAGDVDTATSVRQSLSLLNTSGFPSTLTRPRFSREAIRDFRLPVEPQPQTPSGKKSKAGGLALGLFGLAIAGAGGYLGAKSKPYEIVTPGLPCNGLTPNGQCLEIPTKRIKTGANPGMWMGIGLVGLGLGVAVAGFRRM